MHKHYRLYIDETGVCDINDNSKYFILSGCLINEEKQGGAKILADQVKFKYWSKTNIVLHSREIGLCCNDFRQFKTDDARRSEFERDLYKFLGSAPINMIMVSVDKTIAKEKGWNQRKIIEETSKCLLRNFISFLLSNDNYRGRITIESSDKDIYYLKLFNYFISPGCLEFAQDHRHMKKVITSISFVTKNNNDIEEQVADLLAYAAKCKLERDAKAKIFRAGSYEDRMIKILQHKLLPGFTKPKEKKMGLLVRFEPNCMLPK